MPATWSPHAATWHACWAASLHSRAYPAVAACVRAFFGGGGYACSWGCGAAAAHLRGGREQAEALHLEYLVELCGEHVAVRGHERDVSHVEHHADRAAELRPCAKGEGGGNARRTVIARWMSHDHVGLAAGGGAHAHAGRRPWHQWPVAVRS